MSSQTVRPGMIYRGSIEEARGAVVIDAWPCRCDGWEHRSTHVTTTVRLGGRIETLVHARLESFRQPEHGLPA